MLAGMLLPSGNDAAYTTAIHVGGSIENFALMMNSKAKEIGAYDTSFKNPHGLDTEGHYSTAYDLALITRYALKYDLFNETIKAKTKEIKVNSEIRVLNNTNALLKTYEYADGGKTGYTDKAERCLICTATKNNFRIIAVVLGAESTELRFNTCKNIMEDTFNRYSKKDVSNMLKFEIDIPVIKGEEDYFKVIVDESDIIYPVREDEIDKIYVKQDIIPTLNGGDEKGKYLGKIQLILGNDIIFSKDYFLKEDIEKKSVKKYYNEIVNLFV
ncbi:MAG: D-alanyl-D-alanine carboxypeptidase [Clostridia bacterium]|nr:D-alanyl-D-alanine carboxypeptidase [Clostridia bacterium]